MRAAKQTNEMSNATMMAIAKHDERLKGFIDDYEIVLNEPAALNLQSTISSFGAAKDLACKLIVNKTSTPFITSDYPVIKYNQFLEKRKFHGGRTGLATKGLQVFYPLSPKLIVMLYDGKVYKAGFRKQQTIETADSRKPAFSPFVIVIIYISGLSIKYRVQRHLICVRIDSVPTNENT